MLKTSGCDVSMEHREGCAIPWIFVVVICVCIISFPLASGNVSFGDDVLFHIKRLQSISMCLMSGEFPARIYGDWMLGYGSPTGIFYPSLFLYLPALLIVEGMPLLLAYNVFWFLTVALTAGLTYYSVFLLTHSHSVGAVTSVCYTSSWYYLNNVYLRSDVGETVAMAFFPLALVATITMFDRNVAEPSVGAWRLAVLGYTGIIQSHILSACILVLAIGVLYLYYVIEQKHLVNPNGAVKTLLWTLLLNAWFVGPFLFFYSHMQFNIQSTFTTLHDKAASVQEVMHMFIAWDPLLVCFVGVMVVSLMMNRARWKTRMWAILFMGILTSWMATNSFPWRLLESITTKVSMIQLPWRFMTVGSLCLAFCAAKGILWIAERFSLRNKIPMMCCIAMCVFSVVAGQKISCHMHERTFSLIPQSTVDWMRDQEKSEMYDDYLYRGIHMAQLMSWNEKFTQNPTTWVGRMGGNTLSVRWKHKGMESFELPVLYYPGYRIIDGDVSVTLGESERHLIILKSSLEEGEVLISYCGLPWFSLLDVVSGSAFLVFVAFWIRSRLKQGATFLNSRESEVQ